MFKLDLEQAEEPEIKLPTSIGSSKKQAAASKLLQSCLTLCDPTDGSPPGSPIPGILQARTLEWVAISSSNAWKWKVKVKSLSRVQLLATPWTAAYQASPSMGFSRQEYWSGVPLDTFKLHMWLTLYFSFFSWTLLFWTQAFLMILCMFVAISFSSADYQIFWRDDEMCQQRLHLLLYKHLYAQ